MMINIILIILTIVAVIYTHKRAYRKGVSDGRIQVLEEDLIRQEKKDCHIMDDQLIDFINNHRVGVNKEHAKIQHYRRKQHLTLAA